jgi:hypothetical protein
VDPEGDPDVPQSRTPPRQPRTRFWQTRPARDNPARQYNRPADAKLLDVPGLLIVAGLALAGFVLALVLTKHIF